MRSVEVKFSGVPLSSVPPEFLHRNGGKRINYFEIPWGASVPGHGRILVSSNQLTDIENNLRTSGNGYADLELRILENGEEVESIVMKKIVLMSAHPVWGDTFTSTDKKNNFGLWELELQDYRTIYLMKLMDQVGSNENHLAVFNARTVSDDEYLRHTLKNPTTSPTPYQWKELIDECFLKVGKSLDNVPNPSVFPQNVNLSAIPALLAADLLVAHYSCRRAIRYNPVDDSFFLANIHVDSLFEEFEERKIFGGFSKVYPISIPHKVYRYYAGKELKSDISSEPKPSVKNFLTVSSANTTYLPEGTQGIGSVVQDTVLPFYDRYRISNGLDSSYARRTLPQFHGAYHGFIKKFITEKALVGLVRYNWMDIPFTEVHCGVQSPIRTVLDGPCAHFLRDTPLRLSIDGDLSLPLIFSDGRLRRVRIKSILSSHLVGTPVDENNQTAGLDIEIAYPWDIMDQRIPGWSYSWTSPQTRVLVRFSDAYTEYQAITPPYQVNDYIFVNKPYGKSGHYKVTGEQLEWIDVNQGGKAWAKVEEGQGG